MATDKAHYEVLNERIGVGKPGGGLDEAEVPGPGFRFFPYYEAGL